MERVSLLCCGSLPVAIFCTKRARICRRVLLNSPETRHLRPGGYEAQKEGISAIYEQFRMLEELWGELWGGMSAILDWKTILGCVERLIPS